MIRCIKVYLTQALLAFCCAIPALAQNIAVGKPDLWSAMPEVDIVVNVSAQRIFSDAIPRILADQPQMSSSYKLMLSGVKAETGIDPLTVTRLLIGLRSSGRSFEQQEVVGLAEGTFKYLDVINVIRSETKGAPVEESRASHTITIFTKNPGMNAMANKGGAPNRPLALSDLGQGMIAFGDPGGVRRAVDAFSSAQNRISADLVAAAEGSTDTLIAVAGRMPKELIRRELGDRPNNKLLRMLLSVNLVRAKMDLGPAGLPFQLVGTTDGPEAAGDLRCMLESIRTVAAGALDFYINPPGKPAAKSTSTPGNHSEITALRALEALMITADGNDVKISADLPMEVLRSLIKEAGFSAPPAPQPQPDNK